MIITTSKHGRTARDCATLAKHLLKPENDEIEILEIGNSVATDLEGVFRDLELFRDGSRASAALHHLTINPSRDCSKEELLACANRARLELDREGQRTWVAVCHTKNRATPSGRRHVHLVLANVDAAGRALLDGRSKIRTECIARICEHALGEAPTLGRHHRAVLKILDQRGLTEVRQWLVEAFGEDPDRPRSAMSAATRQRAKRAGLDLPKAKAAVTALWGVATSVDSFKKNLEANGYSLVPGKKPNVWVVVDKQGRAIGAADRLTRLRRHEFRQLMENPCEPIPAQARSGSPASHSRSREETVRSIPGNFRPIEGADTSSYSARASDTGYGSRPDHSDHAFPGNLGGPLAAPRRAAPGNRREIAVPARRFEYQRTLIMLRGIGRRLAQSRTIAEFMDNDAAPRQRFDVRWDIWGVPIPPPKYSP